MIRFLFIFIFGLVLSCLVYADTWPRAEVQARASANGKFVVRITPGKSMGDVYGYGGMPKGDFAKAEWFSFDGKSYQKVREVNLLNPVSPVDIEVTNTGRLVTIDNWHNLGMGSIVVIYSQSGNIVKKYTLSDLYSAADIKGFKHTTSSVHWRCSGFSTFLASDTELLIFDNLKGAFIFDPSKGSYEYKHNYGQCK